MAESLLTLGLDIAQAKIDAALMQSAQVVYTVVPNTSPGQADLRAWLAVQGASQVHACPEATGTYGEAVAAERHAAGHRVSLLNPARLKAYAQAAMTRTKTDRIEARLLADFCRTLQPPQWRPPAPDFQAFQVLVRRLAHLQAMRQQAVNRLTSEVSQPLVQASLERMIAVLELAEITPDMVALYLASLQNWALPPATLNTPKACSPYCLPRAPVGSRAGSVTKYISPAGRRPNRRPLHKRR